MLAFHSRREGEIQQKRISPIDMMFYIIKSFCIVFFRNGSRFSKSGFGRKFSFRSIGHPLDVEIDVPPCRLIKSVKQRFFLLKIDEKNKRDSSNDPFGKLFTERQQRVELVLNYASTALRVSMIFCSNSSINSGLS